MTFAEEKTYKYIYKNHSKFCRVNVLEMLPLLPCLTPSDQDRLRASYTQQGNQDTLWEFFNRLQRRTGWVEPFIRALRSCELLDLADEVARIYQSYLPSSARPALVDPSPLLVGKETPPYSSVPLEVPTVPAKVSGTSVSVPGHGTPYNGYQKPGYPMPVQDTQPPNCLGESLEQVPQAPSSLTTGGHHEQELRSMHPRGAVCSPTSPCGPLSPTVSFQPLPRLTPRASHLPGPMASVPSPETTFPSSSTDLALAKGTCGQAKAAICPNDAVKPNSSVTTSLVPSPTDVIPTKVLARPALISTVPSKSPISSEPSGAAPSSVLASPAPSKSSTNSTYTGTVSSTKTPVKSVPSNPSSSKATEMLEAPTTTVTDGGSLPGLGSSSRDLHSELELSKPGVLLSREDSQPFSGCSDDLAISPSNSFSSEPKQCPEEDEYVSFMHMQVAEPPSADLLAGNPGLPATQQPPEEETLTSWTVSWAPWLLGASSVLAVLLAVMLYRRRLAQ